MELPGGPEADGLLAYVDAAPSPYHAVAAVRDRLREAGFTELEETAAWPSAPGRYVVLREGSLAAWSTEHLEAVGSAGSAGSAGGAGSAGSAGSAGGAGPATPFRIVGGHTDSPNLRVKPRPDLARLGWDQLALEVYGGPLLNSWLDRDLGLSGRVLVRDPGTAYGARALLWRHDEPLLRIPQLAIHLDRGVTEHGLTLNPQTHLVPVWGATGSAPDFRSWLAGELDLAPEAVLAWDLMTHDLTPAARLGRVQDLIAAPRLDNLASAYAGCRALIAACERRASGGAGRTPYVPLLVLFDHEEVGSTTNRGGDSQFLPAVLERIVLARGGERADVLRALAGSLVCSADMAHAVHPNYAERLDPQHHVLVGGGPAVKVNSKARYASDATGIAAARLAAEQAGVGLQTFVSRGDLPCGSTIGPMTAALTGAITVDVGAPMLSMHSARELMAAADVPPYVALLTAFLAPA